jgi:cysteine synthase B
MATAIVPAIYDPGLADEARTCGTEAAHAMVKRLAREQGLMVGVSSGCNVASAMRLAQEAPDRAVIVTILCDGADKYLSERFWEES